MAKRIESFDFEPGRVISSKYKIIELLGAGWEGEVYKIAELGTQIERAAKFFFPHRNRNNRISSIYAKKLHKLATCPIIIKYHGQEKIIFKGQPVTCLVSEFVEGELLSEFLKNQRGQRIGVLQGLILLHALATGLEDMHRLGEYHGDLHTENIILSRYGLGFDLKLLDMHHWGDSKKANREGDICDSIRIFYDAIGGAKMYSSAPYEVKQICMGLKRNLILKRFRTAEQLRSHIENIQWTSDYRI